MEAGNIARSGLDCRKEFRETQDVFMPTLLRRGPYRFYIYSNENNEPPHIHIQRERALAKFWLKPVRLANVQGFSGVEIRNLQRLVMKNHVELLEAWYDHFKR